MKFSMHRHMQLNVKIQFKEKIAPAFSKSNTKLRNSNLNSLKFEEIY